VQPIATTSAATFSFDAALDQIRRYGPIFAGDAFGMSKSMALKTTVAEAMTTSATTAPPATLAARASPIRKCQRQRAAYVGQPWQRFCHGEHGPIQSVYRLC